MTEIELIARISALSTKLLELLNGDIDDAFTNRNFPAERASIALECLDKAVAGWLHLQTLCDAWRDTHSEST